MYKQDNSAHSYSKRRKEKPHFEVSESWAVSYSDLLMVLMSFFIIYFNINDQDTVKKTRFNNIIYNLVDNAQLLKVETIESNSDAPDKMNETFSKMDAKSDSVEKLSLTFSFGEASTTEEKVDVKSEVGRALASREKSQFVDTLKGGFFSLTGKEGIEKKIEGSSHKLEINIDFSNNLYEIGKYELTEKAKAELDNLFKLIGDYRDDVQVIFVGHTDKLAYGESSKHVINSNLILSSMRAAKAVEFALNNGFSEDRVFVQGLNDQPRNTRSLSVRLVER